MLNYNGLDLMRECLPSIVEAARNETTRRVCVTVIDNCSTDGSAEFLKREFPEVEVYAAAENRILCSYNEVIARVQEPVVILLNNDIRVKSDFVKPLLDTMETDDRIFAVGCQCLDFDGGGFQGEKSVAGVRYGMYWTDSRYPGFETDRHQRSWTAQVALGAFDRDKFLALGGYDDLYLPGTWEDTDISFRAYQRGWHCVYEPASLIYHKGQVSFHRAFGREGSSALAYRNSFLFFWKNFYGTRFMRGNGLLLRARVLWALLKGNRPFLTGFAAARQKRAQALSRRLDPSQNIRSHDEILGIISQRSRI